MDALTRPPAKALEPLRALVGPCRNTGRRDGRGIHRGHDTWRPHHWHARLSVPAPTSPASRSLVMCPVASVGGACA
jgi:hypothetical protein